MYDSLFIFFCMKIAIPVINILLVCGSVGKSHHRYATASARGDGLLLLCGGRDASNVVSA